MEECKLLFANNSSPYRPTGGGMASKCAGIALSRVHIIILNHHGRRVNQVLG